MIFFMGLVMEVGVGGPGGPSLSFWSEGPLQAPRLNKKNIIALFDSQIMTEGRGEVDK